MSTEGYRLMCVHAHPDDESSKGAATMARYVRAQLERRGYDLTWHTWPMPHAVCAEEIEEVAAFLARTLGGESRPRSSILLVP